MASYIIPNHYNHMQRHGHLDHGRGSINGAVMLYHTSVLVICTAWECIASQTLFRKSQIDESLTW